MSANLVAVLYLVSGVLFILALRGLSSPETSRQGNVYGMVGMTLAILTTLSVAAPSHGLSWLMILGGLAIGGGIGAYTARRIPMTAMPQLVAAFHSLVGLAAVFVAAAALYDPEAFGIGTHGNIAPATLIEMSLGVAIGAITFSGSIIAFAKLDGRMSGAPIMLPARHLINLALAADADHPDRAVLHQRQPHLVLGDHRRRARARRADHHPDRRRRHAGRRLDAELLFGLGGRRYRLHSRQQRADHHRRAGRLLRRDPVLHHVQGHEPVVHLGDPRRLRRRDRRGGEQAASSARSSRARRTTLRSS